MAPNELLSVPQVPHHNINLPEKEDRLAWLSSVRCVGPALRLGRMSYVLGHVPRHQVPSVDNDMEANANSVERFPMSWLPLWRSSSIPAGRLKCLPQNTIFNPFREGTRIPTLSPDHILALLVAKWHILWVTGKVTRLSF